MDHNHNTNPIKSYREEYHLSQRALASLCGVTDQVILKAEQGVFPTLPPSILKGLSYLLSIPSTVIESVYEEWIKQELLKVNLPDPYVLSDRSIHDPIMFKQWMNEVCELNSVPPTISSFCGIIKIHPYVIQKWIGGKMKEVPRQLVERVEYIRRRGE